MTTETTLQERLRGDFMIDPRDAKEAADRLDALEAVVAELRAALSVIANTGSDGTQDQLAPDMWAACRDIAESALSTKE